MEKTAKSAKSAKEIELFFGFSLRAGMLLICWMSLLWNLACLANEVDQPILLQFLDEIPLIQIDGWNYCNLSKIYYIMQILIIVLALIGVHSNSLRHVLPHILFECLTAYLCIFILGYHVFEYIKHFQDASLSTVALLFVITWKFSVFYGVIGEYYMCEYHLQIEPQRKAIQKRIISKQTKPQQTTRNQRFVPSVPTVDSQPSAPPLYPVLSHCNERETRVV